MTPCNKHDVRMNMFKKVLQVMSLEKFPPPEFSFEMEGKQSIQINYEEDDVLQIESLQLVPFTILYDGPAKVANFLVQTKGTACEHTNQLIRKMKGVFYLHHFVEEVLKEKKFRFLRVHKVKNKTKSHS
jgi:hypothetical protein